MMGDSIGSGFRAITVKYNEESTVSRYLFIKQHGTREQVLEKPSDKTLFVLNVPPFCDENSLKNTFKLFGEVKNVYCQPNPNAKLPPQENSKFFPVAPVIKTHKVAYVVFENQEGLKRTLKYDSKVPLLLSNQEEPIVTGLDKWCKEYNSKIINPQELQQEIDTFMSQFDEEEIMKEQEKKKAGEQDEEGWITVSRTSHKKIIPRTEGARVKIMEAWKEKRNKRELKNFYTFQIRQSKMKHLENLRKKFEQDKKKISAFKQARKFKPF